MRRRVDRSKAPPRGKRVTRPGRDARRPTKISATPKRTSDVCKIDDPAYLVGAVPDLADGRLSDHDRDVLGAARLLADAAGGAVVALAFGECRDLGAAGADRVVSFEVPEAGIFSPEVRAATMVAANRALDPRHLIFPESVAGGDLGRRVAAALTETPATNVRTVLADVVAWQSANCKREFAGAPPKILLIAEEAANPVSGVLHEAREISSPEVSVDGRIRDLGRLAIDAETIDLSEAPFIIAGGNGLKDWAIYREILDACGAASGGTRVACDAGSIPRDRQIGASGKRVAAQCYVALGISGAIQHLQGIQNCETVVAINLDEHAPIVKRADLAIIADLAEVLPAFRALLEEKP